MDDAGEGQGPDPGEAHEAVADTPVEASPPPLILGVMLWIPTFAVVLWMMWRLFNGRWINEPPAGPLDGVPGLPPPAADPPDADPRVDPTADPR